MQNPYEQQHNALLKRIVINVSKLNELVEELNKRLEKVNNENKDFISFTQTWAAYNSSVQIHLDSTKSFSDPI